MYHGRPNVHNTTACKGKQGKGHNFLCLKIRHINGRHGHWTDRLFHPGEMNNNTVTKVDRIQFGERLLPGPCFGDGDSRLACSRRFQIDRCWLSWRLEIRDRGYFPEHWKRKRCFFIENAWENSFLCFLSVLTLSLSVCIVSRLHYGTKPGHFETSKIHFPTSEGVSEVSERSGGRERSEQSGASERVSGASEWVNGRVSGPVLTSRFLFFPDHSAIRTPVLRLFNDLFFEFFFLFHFSHSLSFFFIYSHSAFPVHALIWKLSPVKHFPHFFFVAAPALSVSVNVGRCISVFLVSLYLCVYLFIYLLAG